MTCGYVVECVGPAVDRQVSLVALDVENYSGVMAQETRSDRADARLETLAAKSTAHGYPEPGAMRASARRIAKRDAELMKRLAR